MSMNDFFKTGLIVVSLFLTVCQAQSDIQKFLIRSAVSENDPVVVSYVFSFQCKGCAQLFDRLKNDFETMKPYLHTYPLIKNHQGKILLKAYLAGKKYDAPLSFYENLYRSGEKVFHQKDLKDLVNSLADAPTNAWDTISYAEVQNLLDRSLGFLKETQVKQIPALYIQGPLGVYCLSPTEDLKIQDIPGILNYILDLQNQEKKE